MKASVLIVGIGAAATTGEPEVVTRGRQLLEGFNIKGACIFEGGGSDENPDEPLAGTVFVRADLITPEKLDSLNKAYRFIAPLAMVSGADLAITLLLPGCEQPVPVTLH